MIVLAVHRYPDDDPAKPNELFKDATPEMIAAVCTYGLQDGKPGIAEAE